MTNTIINTIEPNSIAEAVKDNVSFYWEAKDSYPVLEVFRYDTKSNIIKDVEDLKGVLKSGIGVDYEELKEGFLGYFRIMLLPEKNDTLNNIVTLSKILKGYGSNVWEDRQTT